MSEVEAGLIVPGPRVSPASVCHLLLAAGPYVIDSFDGAGWPRDRLADIQARAGLYLLVDGSRRVIRLGQASRRLGVRARIEEHLAKPYGVVVEHAWVVTVDELIDRDVLDAIEGRAADLLGVRGVMGRSRWPSSSRWWELVGDQTRTSV